MQIYLFWSDRDSEVFSLTSDREGRNLPPGFAPWSSNGDDAELCAGLVTEMGSNTVVQAVR
ncbi:MAG TPA: hypothetical protein VGC09_17750, partial [Rhodopila sp.]